MSGPALSPAGDAFRERFEMRRELGRGGMGAVHLAYDHFAEREVAVKFADLRLLEDPEAGARHRHMWLNETRLAGKLHHPYIVEVYEAGVSGELAYLVMEYVGGGTLRQHVSPDRLLAPEVVIDIVYKVAAALEYANAQGLLHRDIKPANILLAADRTPKVTDFGACYWLGSDVTQVVDVGTLPFLPPEYFKRAAPTVQSDIYAVGVMAYQLLSGAYPFDAPSQEAMIFQKVSGEFVPLERRRPGLAPELRFAVHRAIHPDREVRYATWREVRDQLANVLPGVAAVPEVVFDASRFDLLKGMPFFAGFADTELWGAVHLGTWQERQAGEIVCREGEPGASVFVVARGELEVTREGLALNRLGAGACLGELAYLDEASGARTATVTATTPAVLIEFAGDALRTAPDALQAAFGRAFLRTLAERVRAADRRYLDAVRK